MTLSPGAKLGGVVDFSGFFYDYDDGVGHKVSWKGKMNPIVNGTLQATNGGIEIKFPSGEYRYLARLAACLTMPAACLASVAK